MSFISWQDPNFYYIWFVFNDTQLDMVENRLKNLIIGTHERSTPTLLLYSQILTEDL